MTSGERTGLAVAIVGHAVLFGLLSIGFLATPNAAGLKSQPIDISLVDEVAFEAAAPASVEVPAESMAPEFGPLEDAAAPAPLPDAAQPQPPTPASESAPPPRPAPEARPRPEPKRAAPEPEKAAPKAKPRPKAAPKRESRSDDSKSAGESGSKSRPRSSRLGDDFLKGIVGNESKGKAETPRANKVSGAAVAGLADAIARQVQPCANRITSPGPGANEIRTRLRMQMQRNGSLAARPEIRGQTGVNDDNRRYAQRVAELARAAVIQCAPYSLPAELYEGGWEDIIINYKLPG